MCYDKREEGLEQIVRKNGLVCLYILEILEQYASSRNRLIQEDIKHYLDVNYGIFVSRKTLSGYLAELREGGYIAGSRGVYKRNRLNDNELRLLIDGVLFGQHVPQSDAEQLICKLKEFSRKSLSHRIKHVCYLEGMNHTTNASLYEIIDAIDEAIEQDSQIELTYCGYGVDGKLHDRGTQVVHPYYLVAEKSRYYLICYAGRSQTLEHRRLDRLSGVKITGEQRMPVKKLPQYAQGFNLADYMREHIYMFSGKSAYITFKIKIGNIGDFIDWYGLNYRVLETADEYVTVKIKANENAAYYWALQYGDKAEVLAPQSLRNRLTEGLEEMLRRYGGG